MICIAWQTTMLHNLSWIMIVLHSITSVCICNFLKSLQYSDWQSFTTLKWPPFAFFTLFLSGRGENMNRHYYIHCSNLCIWLCRKSHLLSIVVQILSYFRVAYDKNSPNTSSALTFILHLSEKIARRTLKSI